MDAETTIPKLNWQFVSSGLYRYDDDKRIMTLIYIRPGVHMAVDKKAGRSPNQRNFETRIEAADWLAKRAGMTPCLHNFERV